MVLANWQQAIETPIEYHVYCILVQRDCNHLRTISRAYLYGRPETI